MKTLGFEDRLVDEILSGKKSVTWRVIDDQDLKAGDIVGLIDKNKEIFAKCEILSVRETSFDSLTKEDIDEHNPNESVENTIKNINKYYSGKMSLNLSSPVKLVKFRLLKEER